MTPDDQLDLLRRFATRLAASPDFMASVLAQYCSSERMTEADVASFLKTSSDALVRLALCKVPDLDSPHSAEQIRAIANHAGIDVGSLAMMLRSVDSLRLFQSRQSDRTPELLAAARDDETKSVDSKRSEADEQASDQHRDRKGD